MQQQLRLSQRMDAIGQLTGGLAHDFNNLIGIIIGNLGFLRDRLAADAPEREMIDDANEAALRGAALTKQMLAFARQQPLAPKLAYLPATLEATGQLLRRTLGENITLDVKVPGDIWPVRIDVTQLDSAIVNLSVNARDAMPNGGRLIIEAGNVTLGPESPELNPEAIPGDYVTIAVSDTGTGMPKEIIARVFDPFFTTKGAKGTGLGLSMVHGFVKQSGGHTRIYSEQGHGTTIQIYLPRAREGGDAKAAEVAAPQILLGTEVILVVEDNKGMRDIVVRQLQSLGYRPVAAHDGVQALEMLRAGAEVDLLFTDMVMPGGVDGKALAEAARQLRPGLKVLFTSGFTPAAASAALAGDFNRNLLNKPYQKEELALRVRTAIDSTAG
jgi:CheY-like chemotaxis protein